MEQQILRVVNVPHSANVEDLRNFFSDVPIKRVRILGGPQEVAFILLADQNAAFKALGKDDTVFQENLVSVSFCSPVDMRLEVEALYPGYYSKPAETPLLRETTSVQARLSSSTAVSAVRAEYANLKRKADVQNLSLDQPSSKKLAMKQAALPQCIGQFSPRMPFSPNMSYPPWIPYTPRMSYVPRMPHHVRGHWSPLYPPRRPFQRPLSVGQRGHPLNCPRFN